MRAWASSLSSWGRAARRRTDPYHSRFPHRTVREVLFLKGGHRLDSCHAGARTRHRMPQRRQSGSVSRTDCLPAPRRHLCWSFWTTGTRTRQALKRRVRPASGGGHPGGLRPFWPWWLLSSSPFNGGCPWRRLQQQFPLARPVHWTSVPNPVPRMTERKHYSPLIPLALISLDLVDLVDLAGPGRCLST